MEESTSNVHEKYLLICFTKKILAIAQLKFNNCLVLLLLLVSSKVNGKCLHFSVIGLKFGVFDCLH